MSKNPFQNFMVEFGSGQRIFSEGDPGAVMYIVHSGQVSLFRLIDDQKHATLIIGYLHTGTIEDGGFTLKVLEGYKTCGSGPGTP